MTLVVPVVFLVLPVTVLFALFPPLVLAILIPFREAIVAAVENALTSVTSGG